MQRRLFLLLAYSHTPYRQWAVYRKKNLLILTSKAEPGTFELGKKIAERLALKLPASRARVSRAPDNRRVPVDLCGNIIGTGLLLHL